MGLLDQLLGGGVGDAAKDPQVAAVPEAVLRRLLPVVLGLLADRRGPGAAAVVPPGAVQAPVAAPALGDLGGLAGLLARFSRHGHGPLASSWVRRGANEALAPEIVAEVLGAQELAAIAAHAGVGEEEARHGLAVLLPAVVDHFTPTGELPARAELLTRLTDYEKRLPR
ncbi:YidB family protein [Azohydromonas caseinilytica]|uniref:DUF937 domain-containing protein n=1 Tax=Azohydromonas caseinilytica TaxID=2728836 RepID=A0A848FDX2_9BURK|nr:YidB family protein [Azohydromonas caseinilytica]NML17226.1 DUF937 domain-containing protein [Azohydromonas caseinilytica]